MTKKKDLKLEDLEYLSKKLDDGSFREEWRLDGELHSVDDHPAVRFDSGESYWYKHGKRHRDGDQPAWIKDDGKIQLWFQDGDLHRENGPAFISYNQELYYRHNVQHREDGPAVIDRESKEVRWFYDGIEQDNFDEWLEKHDKNTELYVKLKLMYSNQPEALV